MDQLRPSSLFLLLAGIMLSCQAVNRVEEQHSAEGGANFHYQQGDIQIGQYVVSLFEDTQGNLWFGTLERGVARYDGITLRFFTIQDGLPGNAVVSITEDREGNLWFGTHSGLSKYNGESFTNFTEQDGLLHERVSTLHIDQYDQLWIGTWGGVCFFDGKSFSDFSIPNPEVEVELNVFTKDWITEIMEDREGNIWFGRDGYGASRYDGEAFVHFTKKDGLASNNVHAIEEDGKGNVWFGTRVAEKDHPDPDKRFGAGGAQLYDGENFTDFPNIPGLTANDVYAIYHNNDGQVWLSTIDQGAYSFDGVSFTNYPLHHLESGTPKAIQSILKDRNGNMWFGCTGGLFRLNSSGVANVTTDALGLNIRFNTIHQYESK